MRLLLGLVVILSGCGAARTDAERVRRAVAHPPQAGSNGAIEQRYDGPGLVCGEAFALLLKADEGLLRRDPQIDFLTYRIDGPDGSFLLYEGNAPQPPDDRIETGLNFPSIIAIHDNRGETAKPNPGSSNCRPTAVAIVLNGCEFMSAIRMGKARWT